jgi:hypothetical protein
MYYTLNGFMEQRAGFEPAVLGICSPLHWASLPPLRTWLRSLESNQASWINSPPPTPCLLDRNCLERDKRIELLTEDWKSAVLPLN